MKRLSLSKHYEYLSVWERIRLRLRAIDRKDEAEEELLVAAAPVEKWALHHHSMTELMLHIMALLYVTEQLEHTGWYFWVALNIDDEGDLEDVNDMLGLMNTHSYCFRVKALGWRKFCESIEVDPDALVRANQSGTLLENCEKQMCEIAPTADELSSLLRKHGMEVGPLKTADSECESWRGMLDRMNGLPTGFRR